MTDRSCRVCSALEPIAASFVDGLCPVCSKAIDAELKKRQAKASTISGTGLFQAARAIAGVVLAMIGAYQLHSLHSPMLDATVLFASGWLLISISRR